MARTAATIPIGADTRQLEKDIQIALSRDFKLKGINEKAITQPLGRITGASNEFQKSLDASNARVIAFGASAGIIYQVQKSFSDLIRTTIDVEKSLKDINVILNASPATLRAFGDELFNIAKNTGQTFKEVAQAATEFSRQGLGVEETLKRTRDALILTRLSGLDTVSSVEALTAAVNSFSKVGLDSTTVINKLANVDAAFAVSSGDLASALQRVGTTALDAGVNFDELLAIVTSVQQSTARGGAVIGNSLKTIFTRIQRKDTLEALSGIGVAVKDLEGNTLPAIGILEQLAKKFDSLSDSQKSVVAEQVGGVFQINILKAALGDLSKEYSVYKNALDVAGSSTDQAMQRNEALNQTVSALLNKTLANVTRVGSQVGESAFKPTIDNLLTTLNKGLDAFSLDTSTTGGKIGKGLVEGIGTFISGPGIVLLTAIVGKLFLNLSKFALDSLKSFLSLNQAAEQRSLIQQKILDIMLKEPQLIASVLSKQINLLQVEDQILNTIKAQTLERQRAASMANQLTGNLVNRGVIVGKGNILTANTKTRSEGHIPEIYGALAGGYVPGKIKQMIMPGEGKITYNDAETIKQFPGMSQPAILPPRSSKAGQKYEKDFSNKLGFNPYASQGFVPNFALAGAKLESYIQKEFAKKGFISISEDEASVAKSAGIPVKYLYNDYPFIDQTYRKDLTSLFKTREEQKAGERAANIKQEMGVGGFSNKRPFSNYGVIFPSFSQDAPGISAGYATDAKKQRRAYRFKTFPFPAANFDINEKLYEDIRKNLIDISSNYFRGLITKPQVVDTNRFKANIQSNLSRSAVESSLGQVFEAGIKSSISATTLNQTQGFDLSPDELSRVQQRFKLPYRNFGIASQVDLKNSLSEGNLNSMAGKIYRFENPSDNMSKTKSRYNGFIPNFAGLQKALDAEKAMGGQPVIDFQKNIGLYVRDGNTQKSFSDVEKDHPEGIQNAIKNSKILQTSFNRGFTPNFAPLVDTSKPISPLNQQVAQANIRGGLNYSNLQTSVKLLEDAGMRSAYSLNNSTSRLTKFGDSMKNMASTVDRFNQKMEGTILTLSFLAPSLIQTAAQFAPQDARTQAKYNTVSQATQYGGLGFQVGIPLAAAAAPAIGPFAAGIPLATAAIGAGYGAFAGNKQGEEMLKQEKVQSLSKELAILQDRFNQTQGSIQQVTPLIDQYKRTLSLDGPNDIKKANLDIIFEKIVDQVSMLPVDIQAGVLDKIREGKFEEIGSLMAQNFAKGAAEVRAKEIAIFFESLNTQGGVKSKEEAKVAARALLDVRSNETGLRYTSTLAKTEEGRKQIDGVINQLNNLSQTNRTKNNTDLQGLKDLQTSVDSTGQLTLSKKLSGQEGSMQYAGAFVDSLMKDATNTPAKNYLADGKAPENNKKIAEQTATAALTLENFVNTLKGIYTDANGKVAPEFQDVANKAIKIAISTGNLDDAVKFTIEELQRTKAAAGQLTENVLRSIQTTQDFIDAYRNDLQNMEQFTALDIQKYMKTIGQGEDFSPGKLLAGEYEKQLRQIDSEILNQDSRDLIVKSVTEQEAVLREKLKSRIITEDQYKNALLALIENQKTESKRAGGLMFADQYKQEKQGEREARLLSGKAVSEGRKVLDVGDAFFTEFDYKTEDLYRDLQNGAMDTAKTIKSEMGNAFQSIIDNSQTADQAFTNMALNISRRIQQLALEAAVNQTFSSLFQGTGLSDIFKFSAGGSVKNYATGGEVTGGSKQKDDVLSLLMGGEYVIKKSAVNRYGVNFLDQLNNLKVPKMADGGSLRQGGESQYISMTNTSRKSSAEEVNASEAIRLAQLQRDVVDLPGENPNSGGGFFYQGAANYQYDNPLYPTEGSFNVDSNLSDAALYDPNNPQSEKLKERYVNLQDYLAERINSKDAYDKQYAEDARNLEIANSKQKAMIDQINKSQRDAYNQARNNGLIGGALTAGAILGAGAFSRYASPLIKNFLSPGGGSPFKAGNLFGSSDTRKATGTSPADAFGTGSSGRLPVGRAKGSPKGGEKDNIPALLMGGEYVINKKAVKKYGQGFFDNINYSRIPKFARGGPVGNESINPNPQNFNDFTPQINTSPSRQMFNDFTAPISTSPDRQIFNNSTPPIYQSAQPNTTPDRQVIRQNVDQSQDNSSSSNITNNVNVNVTVSPQGTAQTTVAQNTNANESDSSSAFDLNQSKALAYKIKLEVVKIIGEQQRLGGLLRR